MKETYLNPLTDFGFKKLFFNELNKELLIDFLNEIIQGQGKITNIQYLPTEQLGDNEEN
ncbi:Rpn family recombination-promoting nuclease/putative transposase, partial [Bacteroidales bacterium OttesenSCG-928-A17]|nr:Rpn family recombination-promoting nuclease/putative transposase [Bacteroidales bacterium OttesenSCG-928-A17]